MTHAIGIAIGLLCCWNLWLAMVREGWKEVWAQ